MASKTSNPACDEAAGLGNVSCCQAIDTRVNTLPGARVQDKYLGEASLQSASESTADLLDAVYERMAQSIIRPISYRSSRGSMTSPESLAR